MVINMKTINQNAGRTGPWFNGSLSISLSIRSPSLFWIRNSKKVVWKWNELIRDTEYVKYFTELHISYRSIRRIARLSESSFETVLTVELRITTMRFKRFWFVRHTMWRCSVCPCVPRQCWGGHSIVSWYHAKTVSYKGLCKNMVNHQRLAVNGGGR